jgi:hypothetical protein
MHQTGEIFRQRRTLDELDDGRFELAEEDADGNIGGEGTHDLEDVTVCRVASPLTG